MEIITCYTHGEATGDPGLAAVGMHIIDGAGTVLHTAGQIIGNGTNFYAAYQAVLVGLEALTQILGEETTTTKIELRLDNELVAKQLSASLPVTDPGLVPLFMAIHNLSVVHFPHMSYCLVSEVENKETINLAREALDRK